MNYKQLFNAVFFNLLYKLIYKAMIKFNEKLLGKVFYCSENNENNLTVEIRGGNCMAIFVIREYYIDIPTNNYKLFTFIADKEHLKNLTKGELYDVLAITKDELNVSSIWLNAKYKDSLKLAEYFCKCGYTVMLTYE